MWWLILTVTLLVLCDICSASGLALSDVSLLLPFTSNSRPPVSYRLRSNACVEWSVDPLDIIDFKLVKTKSNRISKQNQNQIDPNQNADECPPGMSKIVNVSAISIPENGRVSATITAYNVERSIQAECHVFVDKVSNLQVATSTRLIYLGKHETIKVDGFDDKGNKFTTLRGLPLDWTGIGDHLMPLSFDDAQLILPDTFSADMARNPTDMKPVKGTATGKEFITVALKRESAHAGCKRAQATLFVVRQLQIQPRSIYIPACSQVNFNLITTSYQPKMQLDTNTQDSDSSHEFHKDIALPNDDYKLNLEGVNLNGRKLQMRIDQNGILTTTNVLQNAKLIVRDAVTKDHGAMIVNEADSLIYMAQPARIRAEIIQLRSSTETLDINVRPTVYYPRRDADNWYLTVNENYVIRLTLMAPRNIPMCVRKLLANELPLIPQVIPNYPKSMKQRLPNSWKEEYICKGIKFEIAVTNNKAIQEKKGSYYTISETKNDNQEFKFKPLIAAQSFTFKFTAKSCKNNKILTSSIKVVYVKQPVQFMNTTIVHCPNAIPLNLNKNQDDRNKKTQLSILLPYTGRSSLHSTVVFPEYGSGFNRYEILNTTVATIKSPETAATEYNVWHVTANHIGITTLFVIDFYNPDSIAFLTVEVAPIADWTLVSYGLREIAVNQKLEIPMMIRDAKHRRFSGLSGIPDLVKHNTVQNCLDLKFVIESLGSLLEGSHFVKQPEPTATGPQKMECNLLDGKVVVRGLKSGYDQLSISLNSHLQSAIALHTTSKFVSVYDSLVVEHPAIVVAIGIDVPFVVNWTGGPLPWPVELNPTLLHSASIEHVYEMEVKVINSTSEDAAKGNSDKNAVVSNGLFSSRYQNGQLEFTCYDEFHSHLTLSIKNAVWETLPDPVISVTNIEVWCLPILEFQEPSFIMGVGTRKNVRSLYPKWLKQDTKEDKQPNQIFKINFKDFYVTIDHNLLHKMNSGSSEVVSISKHIHLQEQMRKRNGDSLVAKRLGIATVVGQLKHQSKAVYIYPSGFSAGLTITVSFKKFSIEVPAEYIIEGNRMIAHIEGLDEGRHILPQKHNFDDVFIEWYCEDSNIIELSSILPLPNQYFSTMDSIMPLHLRRQLQRELKRKTNVRNNMGHGLSVLLITHSIGEVNIRATVRLRNPPQSIPQTEFHLLATIIVIPRVIDERGVILLRPNSSLVLPPKFEPDTYLAGLGRIYDIKYISSDPTVWVQDSRIHVHEYALSNSIASNENQSKSVSKNVVVIIEFNAAEIEDLINDVMNQMNSFVVAIVVPTGLNLLDAKQLTNLLPNRQHAQPMDANQPFWSAWSSWEKQFHLENSFLSSSSNKNPTENLLCEQQNISLKIALLDNLARELHNLHHFKVESNDTSVIQLSKDVIIDSEKNEGPMYANIKISALKQGFATIMFREQTLKRKSKEQTSQLDSEYVHESPDFLRTFLLVHVLSSAECMKRYNLADGNCAHNNSAGYITDDGSCVQVDPMITQQRFDNVPYEQSKPYEQYQFAKTNQPSNGNQSQNRLVVLVLFVCGVFMVFCCTKLDFTKLKLFNQQERPQNMGAAFNPYAPVQEQMSFTRPNISFQRQM